MLLLSFRCLLDLPERPTAAELLQHQFIKDYCRAVGSRQRELDEAVKALKTHIQIHKGKRESRGYGLGNVSGCVRRAVPVCPFIESQIHSILSISTHAEWKVTPAMVELLAKELRIKSTDLREYLDVHLEQGLLLTTDTTAITAAASRGATTPAVPSSSSAATPGPFKDAPASPTPSAAGGPDTAGSGALDFSFSTAVAGATTTGAGALTPLGRTAASAVTVAEPEEEEEAEAHAQEESLQATLLRQYDELDRLRTEVIPPMADQIEELRARVAEGQREVAELRRQLEVAAGGSSASGATAARDGIVGIRWAD